MRKVLAVVSAAATLAVVVGFLTGALALVTTHGTSMAPRISAGDLVVVRRATYEVGDAVAYRSPQLRQVVLHRIIAQDGPRYVFRGDNNDFVDPERLTRDDIVGQEWLHLPGGGRWLRLLRSGPVLGALALLTLSSGGGAAVHVRRRRREDRRLPDPSPSAAPVAAALPPRVRSLVERAVALPDPLRNAALAVGIVGLVGVLLGGLAWTRPTTSQAGAARAVEATVRFAYGDGSAAGVAELPEPLFWPAVGTVPVEYRYDGPPGTIAVDAELSTPDGWSQTVRLTDGVRTGATGHTGTLPLELSELWGVAAPVVASSGADAASGVRLAVVTRVALDGGGTLAAELSLRLDSLTLSFVSVADATSPAPGAPQVSTDPLAVQLSATSAERTPATLGLLGRRMAVTTARTLALVAIAVAVAGAAVLLRLARRSEPIPEAARIARRHAKLLLPVLPVAFPPGARIVDVTTMDSLAELARSYGLPVLHWSRSGVDTYVVQDDDTAYRYRSGSSAAVAGAVPPPPAASWSTTMPARQRDVEPVAAVQPLQATRPVTIEAHGLEADDPVAAQQPGATAPWPTGRPARG